MKESVKLFLEVTELEMLNLDETTMYVTFESIAEYLGEGESIEEFYHTLTEVCGDYGFEFEKTNKTNRMWNAHETKNFDIILTKVN
ncbi:hypothetical protein [Methanobrevibacter sp.]|uniref:hypothetical protein n=1 Tax=Methanobrevibacter sp. TaxID=66852 RepID=UPI00388D06DD